MRNVLMTLVTAALVPAFASAQGAPPPQGGPPPQAAPVRAPNKRVIDAPVTRAALEKQVKARLGQMMKKQLGLTDAQMTKLQETNQKFDAKRRILVDQERDVRMSLRDEMLSADSARSPQISALLDRVVKVQRQRVDVLEQEQKELATFLTPLQRAKYYGTEEQVRRRMQNMRQQGANGAQGQPGRGAGARGGQLRNGALRPGRGGPPMGGQGGPPSAPPSPPQE